MKREEAAIQRRHYDLMAWQEGMKLAEAVYALTTGFPADERFGLTGQIRRAAVSVPSNIAEGAARITKKEFLHFLAIARGSLSELDTQLILSRKLDFPGDYSASNHHLNQTFKLLNGLISATRAELAP